MASTAWRRVWVGVVAIPAFALAQVGPKALEGSWAAQWQAQAGPAATAVLTVRDSGSTWRATFPGGEMPKNPCQQREHAVRIQEPSAGRYRLVVEASKTMAGCQDAAATLTLVDPSHLEGQWGNGQALKLQRK